MQKYSRKEKKNHTFLPALTAAAIAAFTASSYLSSLGYVAWPVAIVQIERTLKETITHHFPGVVNLGGKCTGCCSNKN